MKKLALIAAACLTLAGCSSIESERVVGGALLGGAAGAVVGGVSTGNAGGALAGAAIGAAGGAIVGHATTPRGYSTAAAPMPNARCVRPGYDYYGNRVCFGYAVPAPHHFGDGTVYYEDTYRRPYPHRY